MSSMGQPMFPHHSVAIAELSLPARARNALLRAGIRTLQDAAEWSDRDLLSLPHFGPASVARLRAQAGPGQFS